MKNDLLEQLRSKWANDELLEIWMILQMPDCDEDGDPVLYGGAINEIGRLVLQINRQLMEGHNGESPEN